MSSNPKNAKISFTSPASLKLIAENHVSDSISGYSPKPLVCSSPRLDRKLKSVPPNNQLFKLMKEWSDHVCEDGVLYIDTPTASSPIVVYTVTLAGKLRPSLDEINSNLIAYQSDLPRDIGYFVSALYRNLPDRIISFDLHLETPPNGLSWLLSGKIFVVRAPIGILPNHVTFSDDLDKPPGKQPEYIIINYNDINNIYGSENLFIVNLGDIYLPGIPLDSNFLNFGSKTSKILGYNIYDIGPSGEESSHYGLSFLSRFDESLGEAICRRIPMKNLFERPGLMEYFSVLRERFEAGRNNDQKVAEAIDSLGPNPSKKLYNDVQRLSRCRR